MMVYSSLGGILDQGAIVYGEKDIGRKREQVR